MRLSNEKVILRDMIEADIEDRVRWETVETEWLLWDAPWENDPASVHYVPFDEQAFRRGAAKKLAKLACMEKNEPRLSFEVCINNAGETHIGWCNCYFIDDAYFYSPAGARKTIGIDIPPLAARGKGYATAAWALFIGYLIENGAKEVYAQTWSGNLRVLGLMRKLGFIEVNRKKELRIVRKERFDALTFRLDSEVYARYMRNTQFL